MLLQLLLFPLWLLRQGQGPESYRFQVIMVAPSSSFIFNHSLCDYVVGWPAQPWHSISSPGPCSAEAFAQALQDDAPTTSRSIDLLDELVP